MSIPQHEKGAKLDDGKVDMSLLEYLPRAIKEVSRVMTYGKVKYMRGGFLDVPDGVNRYAAAMLRHYFQGQEEGPYDTDPWYDTPEGLAFKGKILHDAQVAVNALFRLELILRSKEDEDRKTKNFSEERTNQQNCAQRDPFQPGRLG